MCTLLEEVVRTVAMPEIVILPRFLVTQSSSHGILINDYIDGSQVSFEIPGVVESPRQFGGRDVCIELRRDGVRCPSHACNSNSVSGSFAL